MATARGAELWHDQAAEVMPLGRFDREGRFAHQAGHVLKHMLDVLRVRQVRRARTTGRHEEKDAPHGRLQLKHELLEGLILAQIAAGERGVDLDAQIGRVSAMHRGDGAVKSAAHAAKGLSLAPGGPIAVSYTHPTPPPNR